MVSDAAMQVAGRRVSRLLTKLADKQALLISNLLGAGVELHIIGQHQVTSDLPEFRDLKGKPLPEYNGLAIDQRTRGMGGQLSSCGEENLLKLKTDHYFGRDICAHEFADAIRDDGMPQIVVAMFDQQYQRSLAKGLWKGAYAASNGDEFFAELTMWHFGKHGDLNMTGAKPENGPDGLKKYDPEAYALFDATWQNPGGYAKTYLFDVDKSLPYWSLVKDGAARGGMSLDLNHPPNAAPRAPAGCRLTMTRAGSAWPTQVLGHRREGRRILRPLVLGPQRRLCSRTCMAARRWPGRRPRGSD